MSQKIGDNVGRENRMSKTKGCTPWEQPMAK